MRPYQEEYIAGLKEIAWLTARKKTEGRSFAAYYEQVLLDRERAVRLSERNRELLQGELFPVLDRLFEAPPDEIETLFEFAAKLLKGRDELDVGLFCLIHQALLSRFRLLKDRGGMIRELYWLGIGRHSRSNMVMGLEASVTEHYMSEMRLCFTEAAAYLKYYDEIEDNEVRGYIFRSRANMALGSFKDHSTRIHLLKQALQIFEDKEYRRQAPELPWEAYIAGTHQQMAASLPRSKSVVLAAEDVASVMESVYVVYQRRIEEAAERKEKPPVRFVFPYYASLFLCGLDTLAGMLTKLERLMDEADASDFSTEGMYARVSLPAFYCQYLQDYPERILEREDYLCTLYGRVLDYVDRFPDEAENSALFFYLRQLAFTFVETENSLPYGEFLHRLLFRFAPEVYAHSWIVGRAARAFCRAILSEDITFFDDIDFVREMEDREEKIRAVEDYAMSCGLFHDVGKVNFMNLYTRVGRQWFEEEDEIARFHTVVGAGHLEQRTSTRRYAAIAMGHHRWYDGQDGYPDSFCRLECPYRQMVDVIALVDWLENRTHPSLQQAEKEISFDEAVQEALCLEGRRFSPLLTARLLDAGICEQLRRDFTEGRREAYERLFREAGGEDAARSFHTL